MMMVSYWKVRVRFASRKKASSPPDVKRRMCLEKRLSLC